MKNILNRNDYGHENYLYKMWWVSFIYYHSPLATTRYNGIMLCNMYINIQNCDSSEHHSGLKRQCLNLLTHFRTLCPSQILSGLGYSALFSMYVEQFAKHVIAKIQSISHARLRYFINFDVLNIGSLINLYNDRVILR